VKVTSVDMQQALAGNPLDNIVLQPRDRLLVHRNPAAADPPSVYLKGEVLKPGRYPLAADMRVADLIRLGGGFTRGADMGSADLTEYLVKNSSQGVGEHHDVKITAVLAADPDANLPLRDGDTLTIRQIAGWNDVGAQVTVRGEVQHAGTYGIRPGERLSSVLMRAGGFLPGAYPQGLVFERDDVRKLQEKNKQDLIQRLQQEGVSFKTSVQQSAQEQASLQQSEVQQRQRAIAALQQAPTTGRMVVRLRGRLATLGNSSDDIELRAGDTIYIPKRPEFILVTGQVYNSNAVTYRPHRDAAWYLRQAGGPTEQGNRKAIFIIRADGSVVSGQGEWWSGGTLSTELLPGDTVVVPEKPIGGSATWKNLLGIAQIAQAASITALVLP
jgi:protein involved in polysaccharide export with SLBB domain